MNKYVTNASLQLVPIVQEKHPYDWIDEVIEVIQSSELRYSVGPFGTTVEGTYEQISQLIHAINQYLYLHNCAEWVLHVQWHIRGSGDVTAEEKTRGRARK